MYWYWIVLGVIVLFFLVGIRIIRPVERGLVERLGKYRFIAEQGFHWIIPIIDRMIIVNITENMVDIHPQEIITKDDLNATVDGVVYFRVVDPKKAKYNAQDYMKQISSLARTTLRDVIGRMSLSDANSKRNAINGLLETDLDKQTDSWGIDVIRVELQRIEPPAEVQESMNKVVVAERKKKAAVDFAEARETEADGEKRAEIKKSEGIKRGEILRAEGAAAAIKLENEAIQKYFKNEAQIYKKLETTEKALKHNVKYVIDPNSNITNVISGISGVLPIKEKGPKK
jgi:regulator of protease activity HflC (stomatin/prohibitin superfamily)